MPIKSEKHYLTTGCYAVNSCKINKITLSVFFLPGVSVSAGANIQTVQ